MSKAESVKINSLQYKCGVWDFPSKEYIQTIQSKFIFMGHCKPNEVTKRGKKAEVESEVEKTARIYKYIK